MKSEKLFACHISDLFLIKFSVQIFYFVIFYLWNLIISSFYILHMKN